MSGNRNVFRAGIIPYFIQPDKTIIFMFMQPSDSKYGGSEWQMAKGRVEEDEENLSTAIREGTEELGLKESNIKYIEELGLFLGRTTVYICEVYSQKDFDNFTFETGAVKWLTYQEFVEEGRRIHIPVVYEAYNRIKDTQFEISQDGIG